jgi:predicted AlkP superfamily pyrophosphatase or phosphodiesterase
MASHRRCGTTAGLFIVGVWAAACAVGPPAAASPALFVSVDGLRPEYVIKADDYKLKIPVLRRLLREGAVSGNVRGVLPTVTYPSHTTLITGASPAKHGIYSNRPFDPTAQNANAWYWYGEDIRVPTLWETAAAAGLRVGSISWPVSVAAKGIGWNIPEYAGTRTPEDLKMLRALSPPGLMQELEAVAGPYLIDVNQAIPRDWARTRYAVELIRRKQVDFLTLHLACTDHMQHEHGPFSRQALEAVEEVDRMLEALEKAIRARHPGAIVCVASDHGFAPVDHQLKLDAAFVRAGLIKLKTEQDTLASSRVASWEAMPWNASGSAAIVLRNPSDSGVRAKVKRLLEELAADPANGIASILDRPAIEKMGGAPEAAYWVSLRSGFALSSSLSGPLVSPVKRRGTHGYSPDLPEMDSFFVISGQGVSRGVNLGPIDMRSIAPTLARVMGIRLPGADLPPLEVFEK